MGEGNNDTGAGQDTVPFKVLRKIPAWKEGSFLLLAILASIPWLVFMVVIGIPCFIYGKVRGGERKKFVAPPLDKVEEAGKREYDLVIVGVTGFTGGWAARYMAKNYGRSDKINWAIAGRNPKKLQAVLDSMRAENPDMKEIPTIVADNMKMEDMERVARSTHAVASFAGPFHRYGSNLVCACAKFGTHYADSTGESSWVRQMISMYHERATESKSRIIPMSGYDALPSDMAVYLCSKKLQEIGDSLSSIKLGAMAKGGLSGGTLETVVSLASGPKLVMPNLGFDPMLFFGKKKATKISGGFKFLSSIATGQYGGISLFADNNKQVVKRSSAYHGYSEKFHYEEVQLVGGFMMALAFSLCFVMGGVLFVIPPSQWLIRKFLPDAGEGPDRESCENGYYTYNVEATGKNGKKVYARVGCDTEDPGYKGTSRMVCETALLLSGLGDDAPCGILTPACLGDALAKHLEKTGSYFHVGRKFFIETRSSRKKSAA